MNRIRRFDCQPKRDAQSRSSDALLERSNRPERLKLLALAGLATGALFALTGCPANLANPQDYDVPPAGAGAPSTGGAASTGGDWTKVPTACMEAIFTASCASLGCHNAPGTIAPQAGLDLASPNVAARLVDQPASHVGASPDTGCVTGQKLIDRATPAASWLMLKLTTPSSALTCGSPMPIGLPLKADELKCIQDYINAVAAASSGT